MRGKKKSKWYSTVGLMLVLAFSVMLLQPAEALAAPAKPSVSLTKRTKTSATITIKKQSNVSGYQVYLKSSKKGKYKLIMGMKTRSYTIKKLKANKTYYVKVRAFKTKGYRITFGKYSKVLKIGAYKKQENTSTVSKEDEYAKKILELVNKERAKAGLEKLSLDATLNKAADIRAKELLTSFSHTRPDGSSPFTVLEEYNYSYKAVGENIAAGQKTPQEVVEAWMNSEGHRANILSADFKKLGVGYCESNSSEYSHYWVQLFSD